MASLCPPVELVAHIHNAAAFSGNTGISLPDLWKSVSRKLSSESIDEFQKQIIWSWLFFNKNPDLPHDLIIRQASNHTEVEIAADYKDMFSINAPVSSEADLQVYPSSDLQWKYLTGTENYAQIKTQMGEFPFQLLCVIAKHGPKGITTPNLYKEAGHDPRSTGSRLNKLEDMGYIIKSNYYDAAAKVHTAKSIHSKFALDAGYEDGADKDGNNPSGWDEKELKAHSRNIKQTRKQIMSALKSAPNQLRGFRDLKIELNLNFDRPSRIYYNSITQTLERQGYIEKLLVKVADLERDKSVYCIKFLKDLPGNDEQVTDFANLGELDEQEDDQDDQDDQDESNLQLTPRYNRIFPLSNQFYQFIASHETNGTTLMDVCRSLGGVNYYRPFTRFMDSFSSFTSDGKHLKSLKNYNDPHSELTVVRIFDFDGKFRFNRFFTRQYVKALDAKPVNEKPQKDVVVHSTTLKHLNKSLAVKMGKTPTGPLLDNKVRKNASPLNGKRGASSEPPAPKAPKRLKKGRPSKADLQKEKELEEQRKAEESQNKVQDTNGDENENENEINDTASTGLNVNVATEETHISPDLLTVTSRQATPTPLIIDESVSTIPEEPPADTPTHISASDMPTPRFRIKSGPRKYRPSAGKPVDKGITMKSIKRRQAILDLIKKDGGVKYTSTAFLRELDEYLGNKQGTDGKTLARDISQLIFNGDLEAQPIIVQRSTQKFSKKILILNDPRPSDEVIEAAKQKCLTEKGVPVASAKPPRMINSDNLHLFSKASLRRRGPSTNRLSSLNADEYHHLEQSGLDFSDYRKAKDGSLVKIKRRSKRDPTTDSKPASRGVRSRKGEKGEKGQSTTVTKKEGHQDPLLSIVSKKKRRRPRKLASKGRKPGVAGGVKRFRSSVKFDRAAATILYRAIVIHKCLRKSAIDFNEIGKLIDIDDDKEVIRKWKVTRRSIGGLDALLKGTQSFEQIVLRGIEDNLVSEKDLKECDLQFFLDLWRDFDSTELEIVDKTPLFAMINQNSDSYELVKSKDNPFDILDELDDKSMRQKELLVSTHILSYREPEPLKHDEFDVVKTTIKAVVSTDENYFSNQRSKAILSAFPEKVVDEATSVMMNDKELAYFSLKDSNARFSLDDKFNNTFVTKPFGQSFFNGADSFRMIMEELSQAKKGLIISHGIQPSQMAALLQLTSQYLVSMLRIDKFQKWDTYESRLIDRDTLNSDIVVHCDHERAASKLQSKPIPLGKACSKIWLDINGAINSQLWKKIIMTILNYLVFRPGITDELLHGKLSAVLNVADYESVMSWLRDTNCVRKEGNAYWVDNDWYSILGPGE